MAVLYDLPDELLGEIIVLCDTRKLLTVSRRLYAAAIAYHHRRIRVEGIQIARFARALVNQPTLATHVQSLSALYDDPTFSNQIPETDTERLALPSLHETIASHITELVDPSLHHTMQGNNAYLWSTTLTLILYLLPNLKDLTITPHLSSVPLFWAIRLNPPPPGLCSIRSLVVLLPEWHGPEIFVKMFPALSLPNLAHIDFQTENHISWRNVPLSDVDTALEDMPSQRPHSSTTLHSIMLKSAILPNSVLANVLQVPTPGTLTHFTYELESTIWDSKEFFDAVAPLHDTLETLSITVASSMRWEGSRFRELPSLRDFVAVRHLEIEYDFLFGHPTRDGSRELLEALPPSLHILSIYRPDRAKVIAAEARLRPVVEGLSSLQLIQIFRDAHFQSSGQFLPNPWSQDFQDLCRWNDVKVLHVMPQQ